MFEGAGEKFESFSEGLGQINEGVVNATEKIQQGIMIMEQTSER